MTSYVKIRLMSAFAKNPLLSYFELKKYATLYLGIILFIRVTFFNRTNFMLKFQLFTNFFLVQLFLQNLSATLVPTSLVLDCVGIQI